MDLGQAGRVERPVLAGAAAFQAGYAPALAPHRAHAIARAALAKVPADACKVGVEVVHGEFAHGVESAAGPSGL